jgi:YegS/Rv2252/BmrU family lipid kinase
VTSPFGRIVLVADPASAPAVPGIERLLAAQALEHRSEIAAHPGEAVRVARQAIAAGERFVVAVGGDDVVHDVVNGMLDDGSPGEPPVVGVVPAGIDNEFFRQFGLPMDVENAVRHLAGDALFPIDVGQVTFADERGDPRTRYMANVLEVGLGARTAPWTAGGSRLRTFLRFWRAVLASKSSTVHVLAARQAYDGPAWGVVVGNGRFGAGGFRISPRSFPGDGVFDVLVHHGPRSAAVTSLPKAIRGEQVPSPHIAELRGNRIRVEADPPMPLAIDGRPLGRTPASIEVRHHALMLKI